MLITLWPIKKKSTFIFRSDRKKQWREWIHNFDRLGERKEDALEKIHSSSVMDHESCDAKSMENIFSSYCNQKKVPRQLLMGQSVEVLRSLPHDIKYITLKLTVGFNSYKLLRMDQNGNEIPTQIGLVPILLNANTV